MAVCLSCLGFALVFHSLIFCVSASQQAILSVQAPVVYVEAGKSVSLNCRINGTSLLANRVSWKHEGQWLHNQTRQQGTKVQLILRKLGRQEGGIYQCGVFNFSGLRPNEAIPKDRNVTILVGGPISKSLCVTNGKEPPEISLIWNTIDDYPFTYNVFFCHKPSINNRFCLRPPYGYNISRECTDLSSSAGSMVVECNVTSLFKRLFPYLFDVHEQIIGRPVIAFTVNIGNVQSDSYGNPEPCNAWDLVKCTKPVNIHVHVHKSRRRTLSLGWDAPNDVGYFATVLRYTIVIKFNTADGGASVPYKTIYYVSRDMHQVVNLNYDIIGLHPYTMYDIYIACSINSAHYSNSTSGKFVGPFSARTVEEEPSRYPVISEDLTSTVLHGERRDVTLQWKLPDNRTWNGIITQIELHYWKTNSSVPESHNISVVLHNISMTTATLTNLSLYDTYAVVMQMCTRVGCGPRSQKIFIVRREMPVPGTHKPRTKKQGNFYVIIGVTLGLLLCIACAVLVAYLWSKKFRKRRNQDKMKPDLSEAIGALDPPYLYDNANEPSKIEDSGDYDETIAPLLGGKNEYVEIRASKPESLTPTRSPQHDRADFQNSSEV